MKIETIEDLVMRLKSLEVSAHIWKWDSDLASEVIAIETFYKELHKGLDKFIKLTVSEVGHKDNGFQLLGFAYLPITETNILEVVEEVKDFLLNKVRTPNGPFHPELDSALVSIISTLKMFNYTLMLE